MNRKKVVRVELILLAVVTLLLAYRVLQGPPVPKGAVVLSDIELDRVRHAAFSVDRPVRVLIDAVGSFESRGEREPRLAAYGWVLDRARRDVVWEMDPSSAVRERGSVASKRDTIEVGPGTYDVFYTAHGNRNSSHFGFSIFDRLFGNESAWRNDEKRWKLIVRQVNGEEITLKRLKDEPDDQLAPRPENLIWSTAPMRGHQADEQVFQVSTPARLGIYAVGEIERNRMDYGWIENAFTNERIWEMTLENTRHAGGWSVNRLFHDTLSVQDGIYRAVYQTDPRQNWDDWVGNPPYDPAAWGMTLSADPVAAVSPFAPLTSRHPLVELTRVGNDERRLAQFRVNQPVQLAAYAVGEIGESGRYDWAWLRNNDSQERVWEMTWTHSRRSGDDNTNRAELAFFQLEPATYTLGYETDDSHAFDSWRHGRPEHPDRWGVTLYSVEEQIDSTAVEVLSYERVSLADVDDEPEPPEPPDPLSELPAMPGSTLVSISEIGNEERLSKTFSLVEPSRLHVVALGEISISGRYDYGWIERAENGEIVWEMTWQNTSPAGGADRNRRYDGTITLQPGEYVVHYRSDFSHAYGDFGDEPPAHPQSWGIRVSKL